MGLVDDLNPTNYQEEKQRFLNNPTFNPQFHYKREFSQEELSRHGFPADGYQQLAQRIIDATFQQFTPHELQAQRGRLLTQDKVTAAIQQFLQAHSLENRFPIVWSDKFVSRASIDAHNTIRLRLPCSVYEEDLSGLIYHEIGTHVLRRVNYEQQPWYKKKHQFGFSPHLKTEDGMAVLHSLFPKTEVFAYRPAIYHLATYKAQEGSFLDVWQFLLQYYAEDQETAFTIAVKKKRGLTDTSQPGGFTKDLVYFEGFVDITRFMIANHFPLKALYLGKLSWRDVDRAQKLNPDYEPLLPIFYTRDPAAYERRVREIAKTNFLI